MAALQDILGSMNAHAAIFAFIFIALDVVSGIIKGASQKNISSKIMKRGFWHKSAILLVIVVSGVIDYATRTGLNIGFNAPIFEGACVYVCVMELVSILENITEINPELKGSKVLGLFGHRDILDSDSTQESEQGEQNG